MADGLTRARRRGSKPRQSDRNTFELDMEHLREDIGVR